MCVRACVPAWYAYTCVHTHVYIHMYTHTTYTSACIWSFLQNGNISVFGTYVITRSMPLEGSEKQNRNVNVLTRFNTIAIQCNDLVERDFVSLSTVKHFYYLGVALSRCYECTQISTHGLVKHLEFISNLFQLLKHDLTAAKSWRLNPGSDLV